MCFVVFQSNPTSVDLTRLFVAQTDTFKQKSVNYDYLLFWQDVL